MRVNMSISMSVNISVINSFSHFSSFPFSIQQVSPGSSPSQHKFWVMVKIVGISILKGGALIADPIVLSRADDLSSFGFFQRQVRIE